MQKYEHDSPGSFPIPLSREFGVNYVNSSGYTPLHGSHIHWIQEKPDMDASDQDIEVLITILSKGSQSVETIENLLDGFNCHPRGHGAFYRALGKCFS